MKSKHTELPWKVSDCVNKEIAMTCHTLNEEDAAFIVKACNNHDKLVDMLLSLILITKNKPEYKASFDKAQALLTELKRDK